MSTVSVIVLAYGVEEHLDSCVRAVLNQAGEGSEVLVVDNGAASAVDRLPDHARLRVIRPGANLGFAGGCNEAARHASGDVLVFVNSDAVLADGALARLTEAVTITEVGLACGGVRLADRPDAMNSVGNPVHFVGLAWAGGLGEPASGHTRVVDVPSICGAFFAVRRDVWTALGGFPAEFFCYHEDVELSLRARQRGLRLIMEPAAVAFHHYEFSRNPRKMYLLERNRLLSVLTVYPAAVLAAAAPALLLFECAVTLLALRQGWLQQKMDGWRWLVRNAGWVRARRARVQADRLVSAAVFAGMLTTSLTPTGDSRMLAVANRALGGYWSCARRLLRLL